jgi:DNA-binding protein HU-beta
LTDARTGGNQNKGQGDKQMAQKAMTKTQLVAAIADKTGSDKAAANRFLDALTGVVAAEVADGGTVTLPGLAKFACRVRPARTVRNPATGASIEKPADKVAKVTIAKALKDMVAG